MIPCCCKSLWRMLEDPLGTSENRAVPGMGSESHLISPYHMRHLLYVVLVFWMGFVLWRVDMEVKAAKAYTASGNNHATSLMESVAQRIEHQRAHVIISYVIIPGSLPIMAYMFYRVVIRGVDYEEKGDCPLGYTADDGNDTMTQGELSVQRLLGGSEPDKSPFRYSDDGYGEEGDSDDHGDRDDGATETSRILQRPSKPPPLPPYPGKVGTYRGALLDGLAKTPNSKKED